MIEVEIYGLSTKGEGVGRLPDGRVVFVEETLPGDRARISLRSEKKKMATASVVEFVALSAKRTKSQCQHPTCGGCALKGLQAEAQREHKRDHLLQTLRRVGHCEEGDVPTVVEAAGEPWGYRHRARFHVSLGETGPRLGFHARHSHDVVVLPSCPVLWPELESVRLQVQSSLSSLPVALGLRTVEIAYSRLDRRAVASLHCDGPVEHFQDHMGWLEEAGLSGIIAWGPARRWTQGNVDLRYDHAGADLYDLRFEAGMFTQANPLVNDLLVEEVVKGVRPELSPRVAEFYSGMGNFTLPLVRMGARVCAVESNHRASIVSRRNLFRAGLQATVLHGAAHLHSALLDEADVVVLDPPRAGAWDLMDPIVGSKVARVVYVSCDPATFARDASHLQNSGFRRVRLRAFDMFCQTPHVELVAQFER